MRRLTLLVAVLTTNALAEPEPEVQRWGLAVEAGGGGMPASGLVRGAVEGRYHLLRWLSIGARLGGGVRLVGVAGAPPDPLATLEATLRFQSRIVFASIVGGSWFFPLTTRLTPYVATQGGFVLWRFTLGVEIGMLFAPGGIFPVLEGRVGFRIF